MNQHDPQQPHDPNNPYNQPPQGPYSPQQPYGQPHPTQPYAMPPQPPKKNLGKKVGIGCLGALGAVVVLGVIGSAIGGGSRNDGGKAGAVTASGTPASSPAKQPAETPKASVSASLKPAAPKPAAKPKPKTVVFKVWGTAPAGALGPLDITYGSDSDNRKGAFHNGVFTATLPLNDNAMYYNVSAQLQGSGDIQCSVTVDGKTKKGHASGSYNICSAQLSGGLFGGWE